MWLRTCTIIVSSSHGGVPLSVNRLFLFNHFRWRSLEFDFVPSHTIPPITLTKYNCDKKLHTTTHRNTLHCRWWLERTASSDVVDDSGNLSLFHCRRFCHHQVNRTRKLGKKWFEWWTIRSGNNYTSETNIINRSWFWIGNSPKRFNYEIHWTLIFRFWLWQIFLLFD